MRRRRPCARAARCAIGVPFERAARFGPRPSTTNASLTRRRCRTRCTAARRRLSTTPRRRGPRRAPAPTTTRRARGVGARRRGDAARRARPTRRRALPRRAKDERRAHTETRQTSRAERRSARLFHVAPPCRRPTPRAGRRSTSTAAANRWRRSGRARFADARDVVGARLAVFAGITTGATYHRQASRRARAPPATASRTGARGGKMGDASCAAEQPGEGLEDGVRRGRRAAPRALRAARPNRAWRAARRRRRAARCGAPASAAASEAAAAPPIGAGAIPDAAGGEAGGGCRRGDTGARGAAPAPVTEASAMPTTRSPWHFGGDEEEREREEAAARAPPRAPSAKYPGAERRGGAAGRSARRLPGAALRPAKQKVLGQQRMRGE